MNIRAYLLTLLVTGFVGSSYGQDAPKAPASQEQVLMGVQEEYRQLLMYDNHLEAQIDKESSKAEQHVRSAVYSVLGITAFIMLEKMVRAQACGLELPHTFFSILTQGWDGKALLGLAALHCLGDVRAFVQKLKRCAAYAQERLQVISKIEEIESMVRLAQKQQQQKKK